jgi:hypothetical protein
MPAITSTLGLPNCLPLVPPGQHVLLVKSRDAALNAALPILVLPFDAMRQQYSAAVMAGLARRSLLDSARLERWLALLETLTLGPLARGLWQSVPPDAEPIESLRDPPVA